MKSLLLKILILILLALTTSCGGGENNTHYITYRLIDEGQDSGYSQSGNIIDTPQLIIIKNQNDFETFWNYHTSSFVPQPTIPSIDFDEEIILFLIDIIETTTGYSVGITNIIDYAINYDVNAIKSNPGQNCVINTIMTQPYQIIAIPFTTRTIELKLTEITTDCN